MLHLVTHGYIVLYLVTSCYTCYILLRIVASGYTFYILLHIVAPGYTLLMTDCVLQYALETDNILDSSVSTLKYR